MNKFNLEVDPVAVLCQADHLVQKTQNMIRNRMHDK